MTTHKLMVDTNLHLIRGKTLTEPRRQTVINRLLAARSDESVKQRFYAGVRFPGNTDGGGRRMYPEFYIPPYNDGKKLRTIYNQTPKTHILSANMYELEIIRLLCLLAPGNQIVGDMVQRTLGRLKTTCFGYADDGVGECFDTSLVVLRFLAVAAPEDKAWIQSRIDNYNAHAGEKKRPWHPQWYFWLCLSEIPFVLAEPEILKYKPDMLPWLTGKSAVMNSEHDKAVHPALICSLRSCLSRLPEYAHIRDIEPYIGEKDGRLHFDMNAKKKTPGIV